jgi:hypothetical protein
MKIIHHIGFNAKPADISYLGSLNIVVNPGVVSFEIDENDPHWPQVKAWTAGKTTVITTRTSFTPDEILEADWLYITPNIHKGYPQPENSYLEETYDLSDYCYTCGIGKIQKNPFILNSEPNWGKDSILQLNWVYDEYFVKPEVWRTIFQPRGIESRVVLTESDAVLSSVVQLVIDEAIDIAANPLASSRCPTCGRVKYTPHTKGRFPRLLQIPRGQIVKTKQYFGTDGTNAWQPILGSQDLVSVLRKHKIAGVGYWPADTIAREQ